MFEDETGSPVPVPPPTPLACLPPPAVPEGDLRAALRECATAKAWWDARRVALAADVHRRAPDWMLPSAGEVTPPLEVLEVAGAELAAALDLTITAGCDLVTLALDLVGRLPAAHAALAAGVLDLPRARLIVELTEPLEVGAARTVADAGIAYAPGRTYAQLRQKLRREVLNADPRTARQRHQQATTRRALTVDPREDGMADLCLHAPAPDVLSVYHTVDHAADDLRRAGDPRGIDALRADTLIDLVLHGWNPLPDPPAYAPTAGGPDDDTPNDSRTATGGAGRATNGSGGAAGGDSGRSGGTAGGREADSGGRADRGGRRRRAGDDGPGGGGRRGGGGRVLLRITGTAGALLGTEDTPADLDGYGPIPATVLRHLAEQRDAIWQPLCADPTQLPATPARTPGPRLDAAVRVADGTCRWPGCRQPTRRCDLDHVIPHGTDRGTTSGDNLAALCRRHHRLKTHTTWQTHLDHHRRLHLTSPLGHTATTQPRHPNSDPPRGPAAQQPRDQGEQPPPDVAGRPPRDRAEQPAPAERPTEPRTQSPEEPP